MTTVDFRAKRIDSDDPPIEISNGLGGPATAALQRLRRLIDSGDINGSATEATASARAKGDQLRDLLVGLGDDGRAFAVTRIGHVDEATLQAAVVDDGDYSVTAVEV